MTVLVQLNGLNQMYPRYSNDLFFEQSVGQSGLTSEIYKNIKSAAAFSSSHKSVNTLF